MGADLIIAWMEMPVDAAGNIKLDIEGAFKHIEETDWSADEDVVREFEYSIELGEGLGDDFNRAVRKELSDAVLEMADIGSYRDVAFIEHKGDLIAISGDMSWGDTPGGMFLPFCRLRAAGLDQVLAGKKPQKGDVP